MTAWRSARPALLKNGALAWVEVSVPESITTPQGVVFRPNLLATTSFDGSIATTFKRTVTDTVCDNTRECALAEKGHAYKVKHSRHSNMRITEAREALQLIDTLADEFAAEVAQLCAIEVSRPQRQAF
jgi:phage/plasmid-like protein (TIGR03299 family)